MGAGVGGNVNGNLAAGLQGFGLLGVLGGTLLQAHGEGLATQAKVNADLQNQQIAQAQTAFALQRGAFEAGQARMQGSRVIGQQQAGYGASGVDSQTGSAALVQGSTRAMSELNAQTALNNAQRQAWGYQVTANQYGTQAGVDRQLGGQQQLGTYLGGLGSAAGALGQFLVPGRGMGMF